jgi:hypothetical protein
VGLQRGLPEIAFSHALNGHPRHDGLESMTWSKIRASMRSPGGGSALSSSL